MRINGFRRIRMPSPFPGMDPYLESSMWQDFHNRFNNDISDLLVPQVRPHYVVRIESRVYVEHGRDDGRSIWPDVSVVWKGETAGGVAVAAAAPARTEIAPVERTIPMPEEQRETNHV